MTILTSLAKLPRPYSISDGLLLCKDAEKMGFTQAQWQEVAGKELASDGNWNYLAFKSVVTGYAAIIMFAAMAISTWFLDGMIPMQFLIAIIVVAVAGWFLAGWGEREKLRSALAAAVLRARAASLTNDQISILKDDPHLKNCRDTPRFLDSVKKTAAPSTAAA